MFLIKVCFLLCSYSRSTIEALRNFDYSKVDIDLIATLIKYIVTSKEVRINVLLLTLLLPAVKTQCLSQCQAFQRLVRSSHNQSIEL
jgi:DNA polymerase III delta subunit